MAIMAGCTRQTCIQQLVIVDLSGLSDTQQRHMLVIDAFRHGQLVQPTDVTQFGRSWMN